MTSAVTTRAAARGPKRSRTRVSSPLPVTTPSRTPTSWKTISAAVESASTQSSS
jgi:hypothetical protein